jgi:3-dehydroquinate synthase
MCPALAGSRVIETVAGEEAKTIDNAIRLWHELQQGGTERSGLLVNLGGGTISDLGGFLAAGYKRGMTYVNIPTSLMGQADAAIGGKTAVNLGGSKNQIGFFYAPDAVFIVPRFLTTLPAGHLRSGFAEIIKSVLTGHARLWRKISDRGVAEILSLPPDHPMWLTLIRYAAAYKNRVVMHDFHEKGIRQTLNFGHTIGHALEAFSQAAWGDQVQHGDAVAAGMICAAFLSSVKVGLPPDELQRISSFLTAGFPHMTLKPEHIRPVMEWMRHDKKNRNGIFRFTLLSAPGKPVLKVICTPGEVEEALLYYIDRREESHL